MLTATAPRAPVTTSPATVVIYCTIFAFPWKPGNAIKTHERLSFQKVSSFRALPSKRRGELLAPPNPSQGGPWDRLYLSIFTGWDEHPPADLRLWQDPQQEAPCRGYGDCVPKREGHRGTSPNPGSVRCWSSNTVLIASSASSSHHHRAPVPAQPLPPRILPHGRAVPLPPAPQPRSLPQFAGEGTLPPSHRPAQAPVPGRMAQARAGPCLRCCQGEPSPLPGKPHG